MVSGGIVTGIVCIVVVELTSLEHFPDVTDGTEYAMVSVECPVVHGKYACEVTDIIDDSGDVDIVDSHIETLCITDTCSRPPEVYSA